MTDDFNALPNIDDYKGTSGLDAMHPLQEFAMADKASDNRDTRADSLIVMVNMPNTPYSDLKQDYDTFMAANPAATVQDLLDWFNNHPINQGS